MKDKFFIKKYGANPFYLFARDVVGGELKKGRITKGFELLDELETFFKLNGHLLKAGNIRDFRNKWKLELKNEFKAN